MPIRTLSEISSKRSLYSIDPDATLVEASELMASQNVGALAVCDDGHLVGILSERDVIRRVVVKGLIPENTLVRDVMTTPPVTMPGHAAPAEALGEMKRGGFRHLIVTERGVATGMVSMRDIPTENRLMWERYEDYTAMRPLDDTVQPYA